MTMDAMSTSTPSPEPAPATPAGAASTDRRARRERRDEKKRGVTDQKVTLRTATRVETDGATAYVIVPAAYTFKEKGVAMRETAQMTFMLKKGATGWLIHGWVWTGGKAQKAASVTQK